MDTFECKPTGFPGVLEIGVLDRFRVRYEYGQVMLDRSDSEYPHNLSLLVEWLLQGEPGVQASGWHNPGITNGSRNQWHTDGDINPMIICIGTAGEGTLFATPAGHYMKSQPWHVYLVDAGVWHSGPDGLQFQKRIMWRWHFQKGAKILPDFQGRQSQWCAGVNR